MHRPSMSIERISSGSEMPSMPRWYRLLMTSIHGSLTCELQPPALS